MVMHIELCRWSKKNLYIQCILSNATVCELLRHIHKRANCVGVCLYIARVKEFYRFWFTKSNEKESYSRFFIRCCSFDRKIKKQKMLHTILHRFFHVCSVYTVHAPLINTIIIHFSSILFFWEKETKGIKEQ